MSLEDAVGADHVVRAFEACMDVVDWGPWEARYTAGAGQPPIHPRLMASAILYGLIRNIRSSRMLEDATRERVDFMWLLEGRSIDHSTLAAFRTEFGGELRTLNRELSRLVCSRVDEALVTLIIDGTRLRANSSRYGARTAQALEALALACTRELDRKLALLGEEDQRVESDTLALDALEAEVGQLRAQVAQYERALGVARERDALKKAKDGAKATPVRVPVTDPDAQIVPNKDGGYAPNYTPVAAIDAATGLIVSAEVLSGSNEASAVLPAVENAAELCAHKPERVLADSGFASGENLYALDAMGIEAYMPTTSDFRPENPANRDDPSTPVPESDWPRLPLRGKKLAASAFIYDATANCYYCPMGKMLTPVHRKQKNAITPTQYRCPGKAGCPLADRCVKAKPNRPHRHARPLPRTARRYTPANGHTRRPRNLQSPRAPHRRRIRHHKTPHEHPRVSPARPPKSPPRMELDMHRLQPQKNHTPTQRAPKTKPQKTPIDTQTTPLPTIQATRHLRDPKRRPIQKSTTPPNHHPKITRLTNKSTGPKGGTTNGVPRGITAAEFWSTFSLFVPLRPFGIPDSVTGDFASIVNPVPKPSSPRRRGSSGGAESTHIRLDSRLRGKDGVRVQALNERYYCMLILLGTPPQSRNSIAV